MKRYIFSKEKCIDTMLENPFITREDLLEGLEWMNKYNGTEVIFENEDDYIGILDNKLEISKRWCLVEEI